VLIKTLEPLLARVINNGAAMKSGIRNSAIGLTNSANPNIEDIAAANPHSLTAEPRLRIISSPTNTAPTSSAMNSVSDIISLEETIDGMSAAMIPAAQ